MTTKQKSDWVRFMLLLLNLDTWTAHEPSKATSNHVGFDMDMWLNGRPQRRECGTSACAIGHWCLANPNDALYLSSHGRRNTPKEILRQCSEDLYSYGADMYPMLHKRVAWDTDARSFNGPNYDVCCDAVAERFGISSGDSTICFTPDKYHSFDRDEEESYIEPKHVVGHMLQVLKTHDSELARRFHRYLKRRRALEADARTYRWRLTDEGRIEKNQWRCVSNQETVGMPFTVER